MFISSRKSLTKIAKFFVEPANPTHRQYEALRAYFVEGKPSAEVAVRFGYTPGSFRVLCCEFKKNPERQFFITPQKGPQAAPKKDNAREQVITLRKQNLSIYDIARALEERGTIMSPVAISLILKEEGFARLHRRRDEERPYTMRPEVADVSDIRLLDLSPRRFRTKFGGLFIFLPYLAQLPFREVLEEAGFPGSKMIPASQAMLSLLGLKLYGTARHSHVMSYLFDEGLALFAGLNMTPKRSFLTEYSCRIEPSCYPKLMHSWFDAAGKLGIERGVSFDLDFHTISFHGEQALVEKHYVSKRSRSQKGILAFLAQDSSNRVFCYANAQVRKDEQNDEILNFIGFWKQRTAKLPEEVIFDSKLTTHSNLNKIDKMGVKFITLRRRSPKMLKEVYKTPASAWRQIELKGVSRIFRTPKILDTKIALKDYNGPIRQLTITDLGHEDPTFLLTNQLTRSPSKLIGRYAQRMIIENGISDGIDFFHMDALSSAVAMKVNCDLILTLMASSLYRLLGSDIGNGYKTAKSRHIFRDFIDCAAQVIVTKSEIVIQFQKRAHNPLLLSAGFADKILPVPWLGGKSLRLQFG